jgi:hypothetical protein
VELIDLSNSALIRSENEIRDMAGSRYRLLLGATLVGYVVLQAILLINLPFIYEEGLNLQVSYFIRQGYQPYFQIFTLANPLFIWFMGRLAGFNLPLDGFRPPFLLFSLLLLINVAAIARFWLDRKASLATIFLLATAVTFLGEAATVTDVIPALSIATLSPLLAVRDPAGKRVYRLLLAGISWGVALFISTSSFSLSLVTLMCLAFLRPDQDGNLTLNPDRPSVYRAIGLWLAGALAALALGIFLASPEIIFDHLLKDQRTIRENLPLNLQANFILVGHFLLFNFWLSLLAVHALAQLHKKSSHVLWLALIWLLLSFCWLMAQVNLRSIDLAILLPPLAILAGWGLVDVAECLMSYSRKRQKLSDGTPSPERRIDSAFQGFRGLSILLLSLYLLISWQRFHEYTRREVDTGDDLLQIEQRQEIGDFIRQYTGAGDCVIIDDPALAIIAERWPTPQLVGLSEIRMLSGLMTDKQLAQLIAEGQCKAIVFSKREYYDEFFAGFGGWLQHNYPHEETFIRTRIHYR